MGGLQNVQNLNYVLFEWSLIKSILGKNELILDIENEKIPEPKGCKKHQKMIEDVYLDAYFNRNSQLSPH